MTIGELCKEIISALERRNIPYMVSGSIAMLSYVTGRTTRDIDVVIELSPEALDEFFQIFKVHFYIHEPSAREEVQRRGMFNAIDHRSGLKVDFVVRKNTPYRQEEFRRRVRRKLFGHEAWVVSIEDLILSKLIWIQDIQSDRQIEDIKTLLEYPHADRTYLLKWIKELHLTTFDVL